MKQSVREATLEDFTKLPSGERYGLFSLESKGANDGHQPPRTSPATPRRCPARPAWPCGAAGVLLATDLAARGLDIPEVQWVLQVRPAFSEHASPPSVSTPLLPL